GFVRWLTKDPSHRESWGMVAFGAAAYFLLIPSLLFGLMPVLEKLSARTESAIREGFTRRAVSRGYAFAVGLVGSLVAMVTSLVVADRARRIAVGLGGDGRLARLPPGERDQRHDCAARFRRPAGVRRTAAGVAPVPTRCRRRRRQPPGKHRGGRMRDVRPPV